MRQKWLVIACICALTIGQAVALTACQADGELVGESVASPTAALPESPPADFAFTFTFGRCTMDTLDTFRGAYVRELGPEKQVTTALTLSDQEMAAIYERMVQIDFFDYPEQFKVQVPAGESAQVITPAPTYKLTVRADGRSHTVTWVDEIQKPTTAEADALRGLFQCLFRILQGHPDVQALPTPHVGCD